MKKTQSSALPEVVSIAEDVSPAWLRLLEYVCRKNGDPVNGSEHSRPPPQLDLCSGFWDDRLLHKQLAGVHIYPTAVLSLTAGGWLSKSERTVLICRRAPTRSIGAIKPTACDTLFIEDGVKEKKNHIKNDRGSHVSHDNVPFCDQEPSEYPGCDNSHNLKAAFTHELQTFWSSSHGATHTEQLAHHHVALVKQRIHNRE